MTGQPPLDDEMCELLALPSRLGGIAITNRTLLADAEFSYSVKITGPLKDAIIKQSFEYAYDVIDRQLQAKDNVCKLKRDVCKLYEAKFVKLFETLYAVWNLLKKEELPPDSLRCPLVSHSTRRSFRML